MCRWLYSPILARCSVLGRMNGHWLDGKSPSMIVVHRCDGLSLAGRLFIESFISFIVFGRMVGNWLDCQSQGK